MRHRKAQRGALADATVAHHLGAGLLRDLRRAVGRTAFDDDHGGGVAAALPDHRRNGGGFIAGGNDGRDIQVGWRQMIGEIARDELAIADETGGTKQHKLTLMIAESDGLD